MAAIDEFNEYPQALADTPYQVVAVTPSNSTDLAYVTRAIHVTGTGGLIYITPLGTASGTSVPIYVAQGQVFRIRATRIWSTGTTATGIMAIW